MCVAKTACRRRRQMRQDKRYRVSTRGASTSRAGAAKLAAQLAKDSRGGKSATPPAKKGKAGGKAGGK